MLPRAHPLLHGIAAALVAAMLPARASAAGCSWPGSHSPKDISELVKSLSDDDSDENEILRKYIEDDVVPRVTPAFAFFVLAIVTLIIFVLWRCCRKVCCRKCCHFPEIGSEKDAPNTKDRLGTRKFKIYKIVIAALPALLLIICFIGISTGSESSGVKEMWTAIGNLRDYGYTLVDEGGVALDTISSTQAIIDEVKNIVDNTIEPAVIKDDITCVGDGIQLLPDPAPARDNLAQVAADLPALSAAAAGVAADASTAGTFDPLKADYLAKAAAFDSTVTDLLSAYTSIQTCVTALQEKLKLINDTLVILPAEAKDAYDTLGEIRNTLSSEVGLGGIMLNKANSDLKAITTALNRGYSEQGQTVTAITAAGDLSVPVVILAGAVTAFSELPADKATFVTPYLDLVDYFTETYETSLADIEKQFDDIVGDARATLDDARTEITKQYDDIYDDHYKDTNDFEDYRKQGNQGIFVLIIPSLFILAISIFFLFEGGIKCCTFMSLLIVLLYFLLGSILLIVATIGADVCDDMPKVIIAASDDESQVTRDAVRYFLLDEGNVRTIAKQSFDLDIDEILNEVKETKAKAIDDLLGSYTLRPRLQEQVDSLDTIVAKLEANIDTFEGLVDYDMVNPLYRGVEDALCCKFFKTTHTLSYNLLVLAGLTLFFSFGIFSMICVLDKLRPRQPSKKCDYCGCLCRKAGDDCENFDGQPATVLSAEALATQGNSTYVPPGTPDMDK